MTNEEIAIVAQMRAFLKEAHDYCLSEEAIGERTFAKVEIAQAIDYLDTLTSKRWKVVEVTIAKHETGYDIYTSGYGIPSILIGLGRGESTRVLIVTEEKND